MKLEIRIENEMNLKVIKHFNALVINERNPYVKPFLYKGYIFDSNIASFYSEAQLQVIVNELVLSTEQLNSSFHKSWAKIANAPIFQLIVEQILHYITTYGYEELGIFSHDTVYIPEEAFDFENANKYHSTPIKGIKGITRAELKINIFKILNSGLALKEDTLRDLIEIMHSYDIAFLNSEVDEIKNKEAKMFFYAELDMLPLNPVELLRYIIFKMTGETLLIKNDYLINKIKEGKSLESVIKNTPETMKKLSSIFYRFKPLFLSMKQNENSSYVINRIRKLAVKNHRPMPNDYLNNITSMYTIDKTKLLMALKDVNIFRKIRLANAIKFRLLGIDSITYIIRNGKSYSKEFLVKNKTSLMKAYDIIITDIKNSVSNKKVFIPKGIDIALPSSEKSFIGEMPLGTKITVDKDLIIGVYWKNLKNYRIDLDFSLLTNGHKLGWNGSYRNEASVLFSGDITDAPKGATELFYIPTIPNVSSYTANLNYFNFNNNYPVPFKFFIASEKILHMERNYMVKPENVIFSMESIIDCQQKILGLAKTNDDNTNTFILYEAENGKSIASYNRLYMEHSRNYMENFYFNLLTFNYIFDIVNSIEECDIDLSNVTKNKILDLLLGE